MDLRTILALPAGYRLFSHLIASPNQRQRYVDTFIRPQAGDRILDIGCGPGDIIEYLPAVQYQGFDMDEHYINAATKNYGHKGRFFCLRVGQDTFPHQTAFDIIMATGLLHHLTDSEAGELFKLASTLLTPGGRLVTLDGCYIDKQSALEKKILASDRGNYIRTPDQYRQLAEPYFTMVTLHIRRDLLRIPYTHAILECSLQRER